VILTLHSDWRHGRADRRSSPGHPRLAAGCGVTWMAVTSTAMTDGCIAIICQRHNTSGQHIEDVRHPDAQAPDAGAPPALVGIDRDPVQLAHGPLRFFSRPWPGFILAIDTSRSRNRSPLFARARGPSGDAVPVADIRL
jgi:hypothetical protein